RNERSHQIIDPVDEPPGEADGDVGRSDQDQPGQKIIAQPADEAVMEWPQLGGFRRHVGGRCLRHDPWIAVNLVHAATIFSTSSPTESDYLPAHPTAICAKVAASSLHPDRLGHVSRPTPLRSPH